MVSVVSEFPLFHVLRFTVECFYPNPHTVVPGGAETRQRSKVLFVLLKGHSKVQLPIIPCTGSSMLVVFLAQMAAN